MSAAAHFLDTSALVKRYVNEAGTRALAARSFHGAEILVSALTYAEMYAMLSRLLRDGLFTTAEAGRVRASFERDWLTFFVVELGPEVRALVPHLSEAHSLRGADLVQFASAMFLYSRGMLDLFVACDVPLLNAAQREGLPLFDPLRDQ